MSAPQSQDSLATDALPVTFEDVEAARRLIRPFIAETPFAHSTTLSQMVGAKIFLKLENLQMTGSYKERGALNRLARLSDEERARGVIAFSAGNHAQGVAYHAQRLGITATIVMPAYTPLVKVVATRRHGARVVLFGTSASIVWGTRAPTLLISVLAGRRFTVASLRYARRALRNRCAASKPQAWYAPSVVPFESRPSSTTDCSA